jgi:hypothetical protein
MTYTHTERQSQTEEEVRECEQRVAALLFALKLGMNLSRNKMCIPSHAHSRKT